jgi:hypothetical protein
MDTLKFTAPRAKDFVDWTTAYERVERYFLSLRIENKLLLSQLVAAILSRAAERLESGSELAPSVIAMQEARKEVDDWFRTVLATAGLFSDQVGAHGRLALFLSNLPSRWQNEFMHPGPWPEEFLEAIRSAYLDTSPKFERSSMTPRPIDLGPVSALADETWKVIGRWPYLGTGLVWGIYLAALSFIFYMTR